MSAIRQPGKLDECTTLIDTFMGGVQGMTAVYLIQGDRKCLIDAAMPAEVPRMVKMLRQLDAFPPDLILVTHPHFDHAQGIPDLRKEAAREGKQIAVLASHDAVPLLADASFNDVFDSGPYQSIQDVTPVRDGEVIDLGGVALRIYEAPGHCRGHIAILDEQQGNLFIGDAIGYKLGDEHFGPPFMPPTWDTEAFLATVDKLKQMSYEKLCLAHFGCFYGSEARSILDESLETFKTWWNWYEQHADRLNDTDYLLQAMRKELHPATPDIKPASFKMKLLLSLASGVGTVLGRKTAILDKLFFGGTLSSLAIGYKMYTRGTG